MVCIFTAGFSYILFRESLRANHLVGMLCTLVCVLLVAYPDESSPYSAKLILQNIRWQSDYTKAISFGILTPLLISI